MSAFVVCGPQTLLPDKKISAVDSSVLICIATCAVSIAVVHPPDGKVGSVNDPIIVELSGKPRFREEHSCFREAAAAFSEDAIPYESPFKSMWAMRPCPFAKPKTPARKPFPSGDATRACGNASPLTPNVGSTSPLLASNR